MKLKTFIKLIMIREKKLDLIIHANNHEYDLKLDDYLRYKNRKVLDWIYINVDPLENDNDKIIIYI